MTEQIPTSHNSIREQVRRYLSDQNRATRQDKMPVPVMSQFIDKPSIRRQFGYVFVAFALQTSGEITAKSDTYLPEYDPIVNGKAVFAKLDELREGPERLVTAGAYDTVRNLTVADTPAVGIDRRVVEALVDAGDRQVIGTANEALLALELHALSQSGESAA